MVEAVTVNYKSRSFDEIFLDMLTDAYISGILPSDDDFIGYVNKSERIENFIILELSVFAYQYSKIYEDMDRIKAAQDPATAQGDDLDILAKGMLERRPASYAVTEVNFGTSTPATSTITLPVGTVVGGDDIEVTFSTTQEAKVLTGESGVNNIPVLCNTIGKVGNVRSGEINRVLTNIRGISSVTNLLGATGGKEIEDSETFRNRFMEWKTTVIRGTPNAVEEAVTDIPSVVGYYIDRFWNGVGTCKIIIDPPLETVMQMVRDNLPLKQANDDDITVVGVELVPIDINIVANVNIDRVIPYTEPELSRFEKTIDEFITIFFNGGINGDGTEYAGITIGADFIPYQLEKYLGIQVPQITTVEIPYPTSPVTIQSHQKATIGTVSVQVV